MPGQEKRQQAESYLKEVIDKEKSSLLLLRTPHQRTVRADYSTNY